MATRGWVPPADADQHVVRAYGDLHSPFQGLVLDCSCGLMFEFEHGGIAVENVTAVAVEHRLAALALAAAPRPGSPTLDLLEGKSPIRAAIAAAKKAVAMRHAVDPGWGCPSWSEGQKCCTELAWVFEVAVDAVLGRLGSTP